MHLNWCSLTLHLSDLAFNFWGKSGQEEKVLSGTQDCWDFDTLRRAGLCLILACSAESCKCLVNPPKFCVNLH